MKIPSNMTETEVVNLITKVSKRLCKKFTFGTYDKDDIQQEAFILGIQCLEKYDETRPLENFLHVYISNRLHDLRRNKHYAISHNPAIQRTNEKKRLLLEPINITNVKDDTESSMMYHDTIIDDYTIDKMSMWIDLLLDTHLREDYIKMKQDVHVAKSRRLEIHDAIREILESNGYEPEDWGENDVV